MHPFIFPSSFLFLFILIFTLGHLPTCPCQVDSRYEACNKRFRCSNFPILDYPFWGGDRPAYCGHPDFQLSCQGNITFINMTSKQYRVLGVDARSQLITVARQDLWNSTCPSVFYNTDLDYRIFEHPSGDQNLTLLYDCNTVLGHQYKFACEVNGISRDSYFLTRALLAPNLPLLSCSQTILVPINGTSVQSLTTPTSTEEDLKEVFKAGFGLNWDANDDDCNACARSGGRCGFNSSTSSLACYCIDRPYPSLCNSNTKGNKMKLGLKIGIASGVVGCSILLLLVLITYCHRKKNKYISFLFPQDAPSYSKDIEAFITQYGSSIPKRYKYSTLKKITNSFEEELGKGGYGNVYKGRLADGRVVAVKVLYATKGNGEEFINEVASIGRTSHVNVVTLLGFCYEGKRRALLYEFMSNGSLEKFIHLTTPLLEAHLKWEKLFSIAIEIAQGLEYLHRGCNTRILHFDIKPHNILLDKDFRPKISDFGLAKLYTTEDSAVSSLLQARGTIGYIAPEVACRNFGQVSHKSDVYSYGMMILEMVGGRKNVNARADHTSEIYYPRWLYKRIQCDDVLNLANEISEEENELVRKMVIVGLWCIQTYPSQRPSITKVIEMLKGQTAALEIPPNPYLCSLPTSPSNSQTKLELCPPSGTESITST
ncbi:LEAF RUST 10 DISEASE-RESISTANCE LOCUS RECEPTOR-LIKE PROTEIN KINASE-like 2.1 isoform X2 [Apium graveolens]|uniref:LEAF RUST 10 DISEASE-RESISTANCE LOCUS RECEPTOR-LIKE PROTEIN KINASE-like 2.1 isoform X2 n=1 Tax=Apium graveolens TaxID=4045 RepID=UPI003D7905A2